ncbi:DegT/DnrJ/EryC1/StrS aminotransferase family protein [Streptomyces sp. NPDC050636]|uniref:DegT/DnrJ/EryC1/StrS family aminotransferase n=1 Tax=Streptomyces sp. NPDC050636 TaxID=3154510 RepID=UPI003432EC72
MRSDGPRSRPHPLPFARPDIGGDEIAEVIATLESGWLATGPRAERFAADFAAYVGADFAVPVSSATAGLHLALLANGVRPGDEVITTPMTFVATLNAIVHCGAVPVLADIDPGTRNLRTEEVERRITRRTRAIVPVHFAGQPVDLDPLLDLAAASGLAVIEDAAHAVGAEYRGRKIGSLAGTTAVFSFHPNKNMTTGEGGIITTADEEVFRTADRLRFHGLDGTQPAVPDMPLPGFKYNITDIQAALGIHQLRRLEGFLAERERLALRYTKALSDLPGLLLPAVADYPMRHAWHLYAPLLDIDRLPIDRATFANRLREHGIATGYHYRAAHLMSYYADRFGWTPQDFPEASFVSDRTVSLPLFPGLSDNDQDDVIAALRRVL